MNDAVHVRLSGKALACLDLKCICYHLGHMIPILAVMYCSTVNMEVSLQLHRWTALQFGVLA